MFIELDKKEKSKAAAIDASGKSITYGEIIDFADEWYAKINKRCLVLIVADNTIGALAGYLACMINRIVPLIVGNGIKKSALDNLIETYHPNYIWASEDVEVTGKKEIYAEWGYCLLKTELEQYVLYDELSLLLTTSGSTGSPKLVRHSYNNLEAQARNISAFFELTKTDRPLISLPMHYTMGLSSINSHLYVGATLLLTDDSMLSPSFWKFISEQKVSSITGVPYSFEIMYRLRIYNKELPDLKLLTQGGGRLSKEIQLKFAEYIKANGGKYIATYGQTEGSARMAYLPDEYAISKCGSIGKAIPNGKLYLIDDEGKVIETPDTKGEMVYEGPNVTLGYAERGEDLMKEDENFGRLYTGDIAYKDADGMFYIVGRKKRFLKLFGHRVSLDECEQIIKTKYAIECACAGDDKKLRIYIVDKNYEQSVKDYILDQTELYANEIEVITLKDIPKSEAGKVLYSQL